MTTFTTVPALALLTTLTTPPKRFARSRMISRPKCPAGPSLAEVASKPEPSSRIDATTSSFVYAMEAWISFGAA